MVQNPKLRKVIFDIVEKIKSGYQPQKIVLFGSFAYGNPGDDSDIDLLVIKETSEQPIERRITVRRLLSDPKRFIPLETIVLTPQELERRQEIGDQFLEEILTKGEVLYAA